MEEEKRLAIEEAKQAALRRKKDPFRHNPRLRDMNGVIEKIKLSNDKAAKRKLEMKREQKLDEARERSKSR